MFYDQFETYGLVQYVDNSHPCLSIVVIVLNISLGNLDQRIPSRSEVKLRSRHVVE